MHNEKESKTIVNVNNTNDTKVGKGTDSSLKCNYNTHIHLVNVMMVGYQEEFLIEVASSFLIRRDECSSCLNTYKSDTVYTKDGIVSVKLLLYSGKAEDIEKQSLHLQQADGIVFFYDEKKRKSFDSISELSKITQGCNNKVMYLVGIESNNKNELKVTKEEGKELANKLGFQFLTTGKFYIEFAFQELASNILSNQQKGLQPKNNIVIEKNDFGLLEHMPFYLDDKYNLKQDDEVEDDSEKSDDEHNLKLYTKVKDYPKILDDDGSLFEPLTLKQTKKKKCCCC